MADNTNQAAADASADTSASPKSGGVRIKTPLTQRFRLDDKTEITPEFQEFSATQAKKIQEAAKANGVKIIVDSGEK